MEKELGLKTNKDGSLAIPAPKPRKKVWITFQCPVELRNEASKIATLMNINLSGYLRQQLIALVEKSKTTVFIKE